MIFGEEIPNYIAFIVQGIPKEDQYIVRKEGQLLMLDQWIDLIISRMIHIAAFYLPPLRVVHLGMAWMCRGCVDRLHIFDISMKIHFNEWWHARLHRGVSLVCPTVHCMSLGIDIDWCCSYSSQYFTSPLIVMLTCGWQLYSKLSVNWKSICRMETLTVQHTSLTTVPASFLDSFQLIKALVANLRNFTCFQGLRQRYSMPGVLSVVCQCRTENERTTAWMILFLYRNKVIYIRFKDFLCAISFQVGSTQFRFEIIDLLVFHCSPNQFQ